MKIIINHLTRMQPGLFCVAGIDLNTRLHVRPVLSRSLEVSLLDREGGPFGLGRVVDLGKVTYSGCVPESEDHRFEGDQLRLIEQWPMSKLIEFCTSISSPDLTSLFGPQLTTHHYDRFEFPTASIPAAGGIRSLGILVVPVAKLRRIETSDTPRLRLEFPNGDQTYSVAVTDIRFWKADHKTLVEEKVDWFIQALANQSKPVLLSVGLSRPYQPTPQTEPRHWLQVNNILLDG